MIDGAGWLHAAQFYAGFLLLAWATLPLAAYLMPNRLGAAWGLARCIAMPLVTFIAWTLASFGAPWGGAVLVIGIAAVAAISAFVFARSPRTRRAVLRPGKLWRAETLYVALFVTVLIIRAWDADLFGLEKFMNITFVNAVYHASALPVADPWLAGETINYYYFGHATVALASLMTGQPTDVGTNLMFAHVFAAMGLACAMAIAAIARRAGASRRLTRLMAGLGTVTLTLGGNYHSVVYGVIRPLLASWGLAEPYEYFFAHSSRFIGHRPDTADKTITEFPGYSITVGDLHAHVMNLPVAAALLVLILGVALGRKAGWAALASPGPRRNQALGQGAVMIALLGMSAMANSWDVPVYLALLGLVFIAVARTRGTTLVPATLEAATLCIVLLLASLAASWFFWAHFVPFSQGLRWTIYGSTGWQLALLYGNYFLAGVIALVVTDGIAGQGFRRARLSVAVLLIAAAIILSIPEFIYVKDLYGDDNARANTMFKLSYQTYLMLPVAAFAGAAMAMARFRGVLARIGMGAVVALFCASPLVFLVLANGRDIFIKLSEPTHVDGLRFLKNGDAEAARWLDAHRPPPGEAMLEASGDSFTYAGRMAAATGIPTVLGWHAHEWLWRDSQEIWQPRADAIAAFYQTMDEPARRAFLKAWRIRYVVIGDFERERYPAVNVGAIEALGWPAFQYQNTLIVEIAP